MKPEYHKEVRNILREPENFFKHADRDPEESTTFHPESTGNLLFEAIETYSVLTGEIIHELITYRCWWLFHHQNCLTTEADDFLSSMNVLAFAKHQRTQYFTEMMAALAAQHPAPP